MKAKEMQATIKRYKELEAKVEKIIADTFDDHLSYITGIEIEDDEHLGVSYVYTCRGCNDGDWCAIPFKWLEDGFDYKEAYLKAKEEARIKEEKAAKRAEKRKKQEKERKERAAYERLKAKYGA